MDHECRLREFNNSLKCNNIHIIGVPNMKREIKTAEVSFEQSIAENFPNLKKKTDIKIQEVQRTPIKFNKSQLSPRHITGKFTKYTDKERILNAAREKST